MGTNYYWIKEKIEQLEDEKLRKYFRHKMDQDIYWFTRLRGYDKNFVLDEDMEDLRHIGKTSCAGYYCRDCHISADRGGEAAVHYSQEDQDDTCPLCGKDMDIVASFTYFDVDRDQYLLPILKENPDKLIVNEYGEEFTVKEFLRILDSCPITFYSHELFG